MVFQIKSETFARGLVKLTVAAQIAHEICQFKAKNVSLHV